MYCGRCGIRLESDDRYCPRCGTRTQTDYQNSIYYKPDYYRQTRGNDVVLSKSDAALKPVPQNNLVWQPPKSKLVAGLLAIFFGLFGAHNFYLGRYRPAIGQLVFALSSVVMIFFMIVVTTMGGLLRSLSYLLLIGLGIWALVAAVIIFLMVIDGLLILAGVIKINKPREIIYGEDEYDD